MCFTYMSQVCFLNVSSTFRHMLHSNVFHIANVLCCTAGGERTGRAAHGGPVTVVLRSEHAKGVLVLSCSAWLPSVACAKRGGGQSDRWTQRQGEVRARDKAKTDKGKLHVRPDIRTLATPIQEVSVENKGFSTYNYFR